MQHIELEVGGMTCDGCVRAVEKRLKSLSGVSAVRVDLKAQRTDVDYEPGATSPVQMVAAVEKLGYIARVK